MNLPVFTIGHSTRPLAEFVNLLQQADVTLVVDVRTVPRSRTNPQYNRETLALSLSEFHIAYDHLAALGGLRGREHGIPPAVNAFWENASFHNYADYAMTAPFRTGLEALRTLAHAQRCAIMCAEAVWWRCHRRIIADYLLDEGETVFHILGKSRLEPARLTDSAQPAANGTLVYPANA
jgi:uncharacterized protein (DUF488 family)